MTWPAALVAGAGVVQVCFLAWIALKQAQVKRELNGHQDYMVAELQMLGRLVRDGGGKPPEDFSRRVPGALD